MKWTIILVLRLMLLLFLFPVLRGYFNKKLPEKLKVAELQIPELIPPDGIKVPVLDIYHYAGFLRVGENNLTPLLRLHDMSIEHRLFRKRQTPCQEIERIDVR